MDLLENIRRNQDGIQRILQQYPTIVPNNGLTVNKRDFILSVSMIQKVVRYRIGGGGGGILTNISEFSIIAASIWCVLQRSGGSLG